MDTSDENIDFIQDSDGRWLCNHCRNALDFRTRLIPSNVNLQNKLDSFVSYAGFDLWEYKADFKEMADLQRAFFTQVLQIVMRHKTTYFYLF